MKSSRVYLVSTYNAGITAFIKIMGFEGCIDSKLRVCETVEHCFTPKPFEESHPTPEERS